MADTKETIVLDDVALVAETRKTHPDARLVVPFRAQRLLLVPGEPPRLIGRERA